MRHLNHVFLLAFDRDIVSDCRPFLRSMYPFYDKLYQTKSSGKEDKMGKATMHKAEKEVLDGTGKET
jgi:hypothetical protein